MVKIKSILAVLTSIVITVFGFHVQAATTKPVAKITNVSGRVLVNQGEDYIVARSGMNLGVDDRVITMDNSEVVILYPDSTSGAKLANKGCEVRLGENSQMVVESEEDCIMGAIISSNVDEGAVVGVPPVAAPPVAVVPAGGDLAWLPPLIFAIPVICAATDCLGDDGNGGPLPGISPE
jgi:hypothetical protein